MARSRNIKPGFFSNDQLADVDPLGRILFIGLWTIADREGRLEDRPRKIKAQVLPFDDCDVEFLLTELHLKDLIVRYEVDGKKYIWIKKFLKHQNPHIKETQSEIPEFCKETCSRNYPQPCPPAYPQYYPQADQDERLMLSKDNSADPAVLTATRDSEMPDTSTGNSDSFPADSLIPHPDSPSLMPLSLNPESGAESNLGTDSWFEAPENTSVTDTGKIINKKAAAAEVVGDLTIDVEVRGIAEKEFRKSLSLLGREQIARCEDKYGLQMVKKALKIAILKRDSLLKLIDVIFLKKARVPGLLATVYRKS